MIKCKHCGSRNTKATPSIYDEDEWECQDCGKKTTPTLADHAEAWWVEKGNEVPEKGTAAYNGMYEKWIEFAFAGFGSDA